METTKVYYYSDGMYSREIERKSVKCPFCGVINIPEYLFLKNRHKTQRKAKFYLNNWRSVFYMQGGLKQALA